MTTFPERQLRIEERWALLYGTEDDGERYDTRAGAEDRVEEIREGIEDNVYSDPSVYDGMRIVRESRVVGDWVLDERVVATYRLVP